MDKEEVGKGLREILEEHGATKQQLNSSTVSIIEGAIIDHQFSASKTVNDRISNLLEKVNIATQDASKAEVSARIAREQIDRANDLLSMQNRNLAKTVVEDKTTLNGIAAYRAMLQATVDVFGKDQMTENVICKSIEAASYGAWRSIMGPKQANEYKGKTGVTRTL